MDTRNSHRQPHRVPIIPESIQVLHYLHDGTAIAHCTTVSGIRAYTCTYPPGYTECLCRWSNYSRNSSKNVCNDKPNVVIVWRSPFALDERDKGVLWSLA
ncbi:hypothetical protein K474DRAFT_1092548 [Panus rudis PR-1116 ss-1]|nr:hypothetical protein K474DRAFT_1092548 [Panus rudis PR-1116 ss-1]